MVVLEFLQAHWLEWVCGLISFSLAGLYKSFRTQQKKNDAIAEGVQSLLRENIVHNYNKYQDKEYCPIYAKESIKRVYEAYHNLGGNDVATKLYNTLLAMPEEPEKERDYENMGRKT